MAAVVPAIAFVGFMGAGKTTFARAVGKALQEPVTDVDAELVRRLGMPIPDAFDRHGEPAFRAAEEEETLQALSEGGVVALGGGAIQSAAVRGALGDAVAVWCEIEEDEAWRRVKDSDRPLARDRTTFARRYQSRLALYEEVARATIPGQDRRTASIAAPWLAELRPRPGLRLAWARSASGEYPALCGPGAVEALDGPLAGRRRFAIADREVIGRHPHLVEGAEAVVEVEGGEEAKTLDAYAQAVAALARAGMLRDDVLLAVGGGVAGDLAGFCGATYMRGVDVVHVPTTLVAQVDSAYGGKTGVDLPEGKNLVGAYHQPLAVAADPRLLETLPDEELAAGFAEVVKTGLIAGGSLWDEVRRLPGPEPTRLGEAIVGCARTKISVVAEDERDEGARKKLNLGHTVGHAIERVTGYARYRHGEAVGLGLLASLRLAGATELREEVAGLLERAGLPIRLDPSVSPADVVSATGSDKKRTRAGLGYVLCRAPGDVEVDVRVDEEAVIAAVEELTA